MFAVYVQLLQQGICDDQSKSIVVVCQQFQSDQIFNQIVRYILIWVDFQKSGKLIMEEKGLTLLYAKLNYICWVIIEGLMILFT